MSISKDELWRRYTSANPHWLTDGSKMTPDGLKRFFEQTFEIGRQYGEENSVSMPMTDDPIADLRRYIKSRGGQS